MSTNEHREHSHRYQLRASWIDGQIRAGLYPNNSDIAAKFECTTRTAQRLIDYMRDQMDAPIEFSREHNGWHYTELTFSIPAVQITEGELLSVLLAEKLARQYRGTAIGRLVGAAFEKILKTVTDTVTVDPNALVETYSFESVPSTEANYVTLRELMLAVNKKLRVKMEYFTNYRGELTERYVDPLKLHFYSGEWYVIGWCHLRNAPRDFLMSRIQKLELTDKNFEWPKEFNVQEYLQSGFGMVRGGEIQDVEIIFDAQQSHWVRERSTFHPTEQREELPDGSLILRMKVSGIEAVKRFVLQYGAHAQVIKPESLRELLKVEADAMLQIYK